jgi:hypothetical protein
MSHYLLLHHRSDSLPICRHELRKKTILESLFVVVDGDDELENAGGVARCACFVWGIRGTGDGGAWHARACSAAVLRLAVACLGGLFRLMPDAGRGQGAELHQTLEEMRAASDEKYTKSHKKFKFFDADASGFVTRGRARTR